MCIACTHTIHRAQHNFGWNKDFVPAVVAKPGETIHFECLDSSGGQLGSDVGATKLFLFFRGSGQEDYVSLAMKHTKGAEFVAQIPGEATRIDTFVNGVAALLAPHARDLVPADRTKPGE